MSTIDKSSELPTDNSAADYDTCPPCVLLFNANDPCGAGGLAAGITAIASVGAHALPVVTGSYLRDSAQIFEHVAFDDDSVREQARTVLEDIEVRTILVGFVGSLDNLGAIASLAGDYPQLPLIAYMPDLSWWEPAQIELYHDACRELLLPQSTVLIGNHSTLWRWLLPDWDGEAAPTARDLAKAAAESGTPYTLVTGIALPGQFLDNQLVSPHTVLGSEKFELFDDTFSGAGDTLAGAFAALLASGSELATAASEALHYLDRSLNGGFRPGMGNVLPDRLFWAQPDGMPNDDSPTDAAATPPHDP